MKKKSIKVRIYLDDEQKQLFDRLFGCFRFTYNKLFALKQDSYNNSGITLSSNELQKYFHSSLVIENEFLQEFNSNILKYSIQILYKSYVRFFKKISGFPKFKSRHDKQSITFITPTCISKTNLENGLINLTKNIKGIKFKTSDHYKNFLVNHRKDVKKITISKTRTGKYFASFLIETNHKLKVAPKPTKEITGFDIGIKTFIVSSDNECFENIKAYKTKEKHIKHLQRDLSRTKKGSKNREKARQRLSIAHEKIYDIRLNYIHNITSKIINDNQVIVLEDLNVEGMLKNHCLAKSIQELCISEFVRQITYKSKMYDIQVIFVDRFFPSSKKCSQCGHINHDLTLADREYICPECGLKLERDLNAALNIKAEGKRLIGW